jgi:apolipoprotein N-acyltransferase
VLIGALSRERNLDTALSPKRYLHYNSAWLMSPGGTVQEYRKNHLVPFSEHLPFDDVLPLINFVDLGEGDFSAGTEIPVWNGWTPLICYEAIYGQLLRQAVRNGSGLIINITNDGWFDRSTAPWQHFNLVRIHAVETGVPVARAANTGVSAFIDAYGHVSGETALFEEAIIRQKMPVGARGTLYYHIGDAVEWILLALAGAAVVWAVARKRTD